MEPRVPRTRRAVLAVLALVLCGAGAACTPGRQAQQRDGTKAMDAIAGGIQQQLAQRPGVESARVVYQNTAVTTPGTAAVNLTLKPGTDAGTEIDEAVRLVWLSRLHPLDTIRVGVVYPGNSPSGSVRYVDLAKQKADLEARYGPRPK